jgi:hypothetical protein
MEEAESVSVGMEEAESVSVGAAAVVGKAPRQLKILNILYIPKTARDLLACKMSFTLGETQPRRSLMNCLR